MGLEPKELLKIIKGYALQGADHTQLAGLYESLSVTPYIKEERTKEENKEKETTYPLDEGIHNSILKIIAGERDRGRNVTQDLREFVQSTDGTFSINDCYTSLDIRDGKQKSIIRKNLCLMCKKGEIEKAGAKAGTYRRPNSDYEVIDLDGDLPDPLPVVLPLRVDKLCNIYPGMSLLWEGEKSTGKSASAIEMAWLNKDLFPDKVRYMQNGELNKSMLTVRLMMRPQDLYPIKKFSERIEFITRHGDWWDIVNPVGLNIIDYIEEHEKKYLIPDYIAKIQARLTTGLAIIILQRVPGRDYGTGGAEIRNKPSVIVALKRSGNINTIHIEDIKSFNVKAIGEMFNGEIFNPRGLWREYKLIDGWKFLPQGDWRTKEDDKKYDYFKGKADDTFVREED